MTVSALLVAAIHSSITPIAFGKEVNCHFTINQKDVICTTSEGGKITEIEYCYDDSAGKEVCIVVYQAHTGSSISTDLRNAIANAELQTATQDTQNTTKVPKGLLNDGAVLSNENEDEESPDVSPDDDNEDEGPDVSP